MSSAGYAAPLSVADAVTLLAGNPSARVIAGGSGLLTGPSRAQATSGLLVDLRRISGLKAITDGAGGVTIGATATLNAIAGSAAVRGVCPVLADAALLMGDAQMRNRSTLGGCLASTNAGDADLPALLIALGATVTVAGPKGERTIDAGSLLAAGVGRDEVITAVAVPAPAGAGVSYESQRHPATLAPLCGVAASVTVANGVVTGSRLAAVGLADKPVRLAATEKALQGKAADAAAIKAAVAADLKGVPVRSDLFGSAEYRTHLASVLAARAVSKAVAGSGQAVAN